MKRDSTTKPSNVRPIWSARSMRASKMATLAEAIRGREWLPSTMAAALAMAVDAPRRTVAEWRETLAEIEAAIGPVLAEYAS